MKHLFLFCYEHDIAPVLSQATRLGFGVELQAFCHPPLLEHPAELVAQHRQWLEGFTGMRSIHGAFYHLIPGAIDPLIREATAVRMRQAVGFAREMHAAHLIFHHGYYARARFDAGWLARSAAFWRDILTAVPDGLTIHLENAHEISPDLQLALIDEVADPRLGICLDIGHAHAFSSTPVLDWITALGERISYVHLHDNDGSADQHLPLGQGNIPLVEALAALETHAPQAVWMIEAEATASLAWLGEHDFISQEGLHENTPD
ncbi:MAG TPA: sugar phosphate isomerase/epimerase family protein [Armatimonadota bacterium]